MTGTGYRTLGEWIAFVLLLTRPAWPISDSIDQVHSQERVASQGIAAPSTPASLEFVGEVIPEPDRVAEVLAPMWGKVYLEKGVHLGAKVNKGQLLARIVLELDAVERLALNDRTIEISQFLETSREKVRLALKDYERARKIGQANPAFQQEVERRKRVYENALKEFQMVNQQNRRQTRVLRSRDPRTLTVASPLSGYVEKVDFVPGEIDRSGQFRKLFTIVDLSSVWVRAEVYEKDLRTFYDSQQAVISTPAFPGRTFQGRLQTLGSEVDPKTRTIPVYYETLNQDEQLKIGLPVRLSLKEERKRVPE